MEVGDFVKDVSIATGAGWIVRYGFIIEELDLNVLHPSMSHSRMFKVLWTDGKIGDNIWHYDLELAK